MPAFTIVWFRQDLRLTDNPALSAAAERGSVLPVYVLDEVHPGERAIGGAGRWWLQRSLEALEESLKERGSKLLFARGDPVEVIQELVEDTDADAVFWNRCYEPFAIGRDKALKSALTQRGIETKSFNASLLFEPWEIETKTGDPYRVYTPFSRACLAKATPGQPRPAPERLTTPLNKGRSLPLDELDLLPGQPDWSSGLAETWSPGESFASNKLEHFLDNLAEDYATKRDRPDEDGTSRLSPYLHWGEISPRQAWHATLSACGGAEALAQGTGPGTFLRELLWREFGYHILYHFPHLPEREMKDAFAAFPWDDDQDARNAWRFGQTGYPIVDAGMRQLRITGWMHNRVRMIVGSFLAKDLIEDWRHGERWFWDNLVDADLASNTLGWQWIAGCGPDAAPYFRIFNPVKQGEKFDPHGSYVRRWVPELAKLGAADIHAPWDAPLMHLAHAGVRLGGTYPKPLVNHKLARERALSALRSIKQSA